MEKIISILLEIENKIKGGEYKDDNK